MTNETNQNNIPDQLSFQVQKQKNYYNPRVQK